MISNGSQRTHVVVYLLRVTTFRYFGHYMGSNSWLLINWPTKKKKNKG